ncbi:hypothetical protein B0T19DRAFT_427721 [Cercophora scortea]|uniref:Uncharacterized protein n=1 Tax=Cercophora scortea TaxID=314031 RepID=A0AAE0M9P3_9PEZI|nr:hypothetical protein B0T19DRAFT_427721 [Cercophora scortea]
MPLLLMARLSSRTWAPKITLPQPAMRITRWPNFLAHKRGKGPLYTGYHHQRDGFHCEHDICIHGGEAPVSLASYWTWPDMLGQNECRFKKPSMLYRPDDTSTESYIFSCQRVVSPPVSVDYLPLRNGEEYLEHIEDTYICEFGNDCMAAWSDSPVGARIILQTANTKPDRMVKTWDPDPTKRSLVQHINEKTFEDWCRLVDIRREDDAVRAEFTLSVPHFASVQNDYWVYHVWEVQISHDKKNMYLSHETWMWRGATAFPTSLECVMGRWLDFVQFSWVLQDAKEQLIKRWRDRNMAEKKLLSNDGFQEETGKRSDTNLTGQGKTKKKKKKKKN